MKRVCSQQIFCSPDVILRNTVVEQDSNNRITNLIALGNQLAETSHTLFYDGIISSEIMSVKFNIGSNDENFLNDYQHINLQLNTSDKLFKPESKPLLLDFESNDLSIINAILKEKYYLLSNFNVFEIIAGCTYYPNYILNLSKEIKLFSKTNLLLWKGFHQTNNSINRQIEIIRL
ncbi:MAG: hypothetical protein Q7U47_10905 [Paludibacter sp.]|nr:hypothetical protein [Paludibacter sp.]